MDSLYPIITCIRLQLLRREPPRSKSLVITSLMPFAKQMPRLQGQSTTPKVNRETCHLHKTIGSRSHYSPQSANHRGAPKAVCAMPCQAMCPYPKLDISTVDISPNVAGCIENLGRMTVGHQPILVSDKWLQVAEEISTRAVISSPHILSTGIVQIMHIAEASIRQSVSRLEVV